MLRKWNDVLQIIMPLITPCSVIIGAGLGSRLAHYAFLATYFFAFMTFAGSLNSKFTDLKECIRRPLPLVTTLLLLHVAMPLIAWLTGHLLFKGDANIITGLILGLVIPAGVTSFIWVSVYGGNIGLTLSVILIDSLLSPIIVPTSMFLFVGERVSVDTWAMMKGLFWMIVLPSVIGMALNHKTGGSIKTVLGDKLAPFAKISIGIVVALNGAVVSPYLKNFTIHLFELSIVVFVLAALGYPIGLIVAKMFGWETGTIISLTFNGGMRNISAGAVMAITYFPSAVAIPVILGMLFQQSLASFYGSLLKRYLLIG